MTTITKDQVKQLIETNVQFVMDALWVLYQKQTQSEQVNGRTLEYNNQGFNSVDSAFLSSLAKQDFLSSRQLYSARRSLPKYWKQLLPLINDLYPEISHVRK